MPGRLAIDKITLEFRCSGEFVSISGEKFPAWEGSITAAICSNDLSKSIEIFSNDSSKLKFLHSRVYLPQSYEKGKEISLNKMAERQLFPSLNEICILMKLDEMANQVSMLYCMLDCVYFKLSLTFELPIPPLLQHIA